MRGESREALAWFERGRQIGEMRGDIRAELKEHRMLLLEIREICGELSTKASPAENASLWSEIKEYLSFFALLYRAFRMVPWGLVFLAGVSVWKFLWPYMQRVVAFFGG